MPTLYIETTIPSYLAGKPSRDIIILAHQQITGEWWEQERHSHELFISQAVLDEIKSGDPEIAAKRMDIIKNIPLLDINEPVEKLAARYFEALKLPDKAVLDALHIACAVYYEMDFLVTWNCAHLANGNIFLKLTKLNKEWGFETPIICTPEELINYSEEE
jgi:hypothetical protein